jgi:hypothetical protein
VGPDNKELPGRVSWNVILDVPPEIPGTRLGVQIQEVERLEGDPYEPEIPANAHSDMTVAPDFGRKQARRRSVFLHVVDLGR